jgi:type IV pilus assembly protein PilC
MSSVSTAFGTAAPFETAKPKPEYLRRFAWKLHAFEVNRRPGKVNVGAPVRPRRVIVYAPYPDAAQAGAGVNKDETSRTVSVRWHEVFRASRRPSRQEVADFYETVGNALMTGGGMSLALNMAARIARSPMMRGVVGALHHMIMHGEDLHVAMRCFPRVFSPMQLAMVEAAASTGLDKAGGLLLTLSTRLHKDGKVWRKFLGALAYPVSLLGLTIAAAIVLEIWALPPMVELFKTLGGRLPPITRYFYAVAQFMRVHAAVLFPSFVGVIAAAVTLAPAVLRTRAVQRLSIRVWLIGPIVQSLALVRALATFILLKQSGAKVRDQFALAAAAAGNCVVGDFFEACYSRIALGESVEEAFTAERHRLGDDGLRIAGKMEVGMAGADLPALINRIVDEIGDRAETRLNVLPNLIRWPLLILCCAIIGIVALAIVLPYPNLIADVAHQQADLGR